ncbi:MAG: hypothetical protein KAR12_04085 [Methylococcales bacterium]|nr:hypothetical protein [Methylococcales bacterium]
MLNRPLYLVLLMMLFSSACSIAEEREHAHQQNTQTLNLPLDIKQLLKKEMLAVENGMQKLISTIAMGDWQKTAEIGKQIQASYLMKQELSEEQLKHLHHILPEQFVKLDHSFHHYAGMLAHAAEVKNAEVVSFYFYKMNESCIQCHSSYAQIKFTGFSATPKNHHESH